MLFEPETLVKRVGIFPAQVTGERQLVAASIAALLLGVLHHRSPDPSTLMARMDGNVFDDTRPTPSFGKVVHHKQFIGADYFITQQGHIKTQQWITTKDGQLSAGLFQSKVRVSNAGIEVQAEYGRQIRIRSLANDNIAHTKVPWEGLT